MGRWILWGWVALAIIVVGLVLGFMLYTRIVIGIGLQDQHALLHLPETLIVQTRAEEEAAMAAAALESTRSRTITRIRKIVDHSIFLAKTLYFQ